MPKIEVRNLYKVFGPHPLQALKNCRQVYPKKDC